MTACLAAGAAGCGSNVASDGQANPGSGADPGAAAGAALPEGNAASPHLRPVTLVLNWFAEMEHGGFYAALLAGDYAAEGLEVTIRPGGPDVPVIQQVATGRAEFGISNADGLVFGRAQEAPVVGLMAPLQSSPRCIMFHKERGLESLADLRDMKLAMSAGAAFAQFLRQKLPLEGVEIVPYTGNVALFLLDKNYAQQAYVFSEPFVARQKGADPAVLMVSQLGFDPYTSVLFTTDELVASDPELVRGMVRASIRGWQRYLESPQAAHARIHEINPEMSLEALEFGAAAQQPLVLAGLSGPAEIGKMRLERWQTLVSQLAEVELIAPDAVRAEELFTTRFLPVESAGLAVPAAGDGQLPAQGAR